MNNLINWTPFTVKNLSSYTFDQFVDIVRQLDENSDPNLWVKWKNYSNQVVVATDKYYYKMYEMDLQAGSFTARVREELAKIYREDFGILWNIKTIIQNDHIYQIEQRQKLKVCTSDFISFEEIFLNWSKTLEKLENRLILNEICKQIKIKDLCKIKLVRDCLNKCEDYAITDSGNIVLLDDADFFLCLVDKNDNWMSVKANVFNILTLDGERVFAPENLFERNPLELNGELVNKWNIFLSNESTQKIFLSFANIKEKMLADNIKVLSSGKLLPNNQPLFLTHDN